MDDVFEDLASIRSRPVGGRFPTPPNLGPTFKKVSETMTQGMTRDALSDLRSSCSIMDGPLNLSLVKTVPANVHAIERTIPATASSRLHQRCQNDDINLQVRESLCFSRPDRTSAQV